MPGCVRAKIGTLRKHDADGNENVNKEKAKHFVAIFGQTTT